jgi:PAS domain S-box-containing protein
MHTILQWLIDPLGMSAHGNCLSWHPDMVWTYAISDATIATAYYTIPLAMILIARRRRDLMYRSVFWLFVAFIALCGTTHSLDVVTLWRPAYGINAVIEAATAITSISAAGCLWWHLPDIIRLPSNQQLSEATALLKESEDHYQSIFEFTPTPFLILDRYGQITAVSRSWKDLFRCETAAHVIGHPLTKFATSDVLWTGDAFAALLSGQELHGETQFFMRLDETIIETLVYARVESNRGEPRILVVLVDRTAQRHAENALRASEERLQQSQRLEAIGQLTGGIAHDFNNMLQAILTSVDLIDKDLAHEKYTSAARYLKIIRESGDRAAMLTNQMLSFGRRQSLQPVITHPDPLLDSLRGIIKSGLGPLINLDYMLCDGWPIRCDIGQLENALLNLTINARDAMANGGRLLIKTTDVTLSASDLVDQDAVAPGDYVEFEISDTGSGMSAIVLSRAVEPFYTTKPIGKGSGLGLSQVYGFARQSGGFLRLESIEQSGTTVRLYLPRAVDPALATPQCSAVAVGIEIEKTVLIVEDEIVLREMLVEYLKGNGFRTLTAEDGAAGQRAIQNQEFDVLLTDVGLPIINGRQLAEMARAQHPTVPILLITGYAGMHLDATLPAKVRVLSKPFNLPLMLRVIQEMIAEADIRP